MWIDEKSKSFSFQYTNKPDLVNVDADRILLAEISDDKSLENLVHLYQNGLKYEDRREAIEGLSSQQDNEIAYKTLTAALSDSFYGLRILALDKIDLSNANAKAAIKIIEDMASKDAKTLVQAKAISKLGLLENTDNIGLYKKSLLSNSSAVKGSALKALYKVDKEAALEFAASLDDEMEKESLKSAIIPIYILDKTESEISFVAENLIEGMYFTDDRDKANIYKEGFQWVAASDNEEATQILVDAYVQLGQQFKAYGADKMAIRDLQQIMEAKTKSTYANKDTLIGIIQEGLDKLN